MEAGRKTEESFSDTMRNDLYNCHFTYVRGFSGGLFDIDHEVSSAESGLNLQMLRSILVGVIEHVRRPNLSSMRDSFFL